VADDNARGVQVAILRRDGLIAGSFVTLVYDSFEGRPLDLDGEAVAYADGWFYVAGSHGRPRHTDKGPGEARSDAQARASRRLFRIRFAPDGIDLGTGEITTPPRIEPSTELRRFIEGDPVLKTAFDRPLRDGGLNLEGAAARGGSLFLGMRGPVSGESALVLEAPVAGLFEGAGGEGRLHRLELGRDTSGEPRGVRELVAYRDGFLLIAGPVQDPGDRDYEIRRGDYAIYGWDGAGAARKLLDLEGYGPRTKPEGLLPLEERDGRLAALLLFDGPKEGGPRVVEFGLR
jgi:hypothetical protein